MHFHIKGKGLKVSHTQNAKICHKPPAEQHKQAMNITV